MKISKDLRKERTHWIIYIQLLMLHTRAEAIKSLNDEAE